MQVFCEKKDKAKIKIEISERLLQTVVLIFKPIPASYTVDMNSGIRKKITYSFNNDEICFHEIRTTHGIFPKELIGVIAPKHLKGVVMKHFPAVPFVEAPLANKKVSMPMCELRKHWPSYVGKGLKVGIGNAPDYQAAFIQFARDNKYTSFAMHAVRLPTIYDLGYLSIANYDFYNQVKAEIQITRANKSRIDVVELSEGAAAVVRSNGDRAGRETLAENEIAQALVFSQAQAKPPVDEQELVLANDKALERLNAAKLKLQHLEEQMQLAKLELQQASKDAVDAETRLNSKKPKQMLY